MRPPILAPSLRRLQSTSSTINLPSLASRLTTTRLPLIYDYLTPQPSHLLSLSLASFLPPSCSPSNAYTHPAPSIPLPSTLEKIPMPIAHHLVYFPPQVPTSYLLPDGTDALHSPGPPFNRRMWAGGSVRFFQSPVLDGRRAVCVEGIRDVSVKGKQGEEKVFVGVERRVAGVEEGEEEEGIRRRVWAGREEEGGDAVVVERRNLVFMRDRTGVEQEKEKEKERAGRIVKAPLNPEFSHTLTPSRALLFRYSALTFNAHSIHLDRHYAQNTEGYPGLLVHGPLTLTIMLTLAQAHLAQRGRAVSSIEYRNLAPLLVEQPMTVCMKPKQVGDRGAWDIWVERADGGLAVRGTIETKALL